MNVTFHEFEHARVNISSLSDTSMLRKVYIQDKAARDTVWADAKDQGSYDAQKLPSRIATTDKTDTTTTRGTKQDLDSEFGRSVIEPPSTDGDTTTTDTTSNLQTGFGYPTKGKYSVTKKGHKSFGTLGQGEKMDGVKFEEVSECADRQLYVALTAMATINSRSFIKLEVTNARFADITIVRDPDTPVLPTAAMQILKGSATAALLLALSYFN